MAVAPLFAQPRKLLKMLAGAATGCALHPLTAAVSSGGGKPLGVCSISYLLRWPNVDRGRGSLEEVLAFIDHCERAGAGGVQTVIPAEGEFSAAIRAKLESAGMFLQGSIGLPKAEADLPAFEARVRAAKEAGAPVLRTACLSGRRYETFASGDAFREFAQQAERSLLMALPVVKKHQIRLAVENHKDFRVPEMLALMQRLSSEYIGICVDTGNSIALLEDPMAVVEAYAPFAFATHLKDMAVQECESGFLLAEVPLGEGFLDLPAMVATLRRARPELQFCLEMITRDPLQVPCLAKPYWATSEMVPDGSCGALAMVRANPPKRTLARVSELSMADKLQMEDDAVRKSVAYSRKELRL